MSSVQHHEL
ncbi:MAG: hypothetical protein K0S92_1113, partial [Desertimonas sp.]|nr:hypothetical protein [Desertimonas sp.]